MASLFKLLISPVLLIIGRKKLDVRMYPFLVGAGVYFVISILRALIRSGFSAYDAGTAFFLQGLTSSVLEETGRVIAFVYILKDYRRNSDAIGHGIGHGMLENMGAGFASFGLQMSAENAFLGCAGQFMGSLTHIGLSVFAWYGVKNGKIKVMFPIALVIHLASNIIVSDAFDVIKALIVCGTAYFLYRKDDDDFR